MSSLDRLRQENETMGAVVNRKENSPSIQASHCLFILKQRKTALGAQASHVQETRKKTSREKKGAGKERKTVFGAQ
jgi:hypothetical protein